MKSLVTLIAYSMMILFQPYIAKAGNIVTFVIDSPGSKDKKVLVYPEGTTYAVLDVDGDTIEAEYVEPGVKVYPPEKAYTLLVYPSYRPEKADEIPMPGQRLQAFNTVKDAQRYGYVGGWQNGAKTTLHEEKPPRTLPFDTLNSSDLPPKVDAIAGKWEVDLRPDPEAAPYTQVLDVRVNNNGSLSGRFYGSAFKKGVVNQAWSRLYIAFQTRDRNNTYFHTAFLEDGKLFGQTYCPERKFTAPWTAVSIDDKQ